MKNVKTIGIDFDDILLNFIDAFIDFHNLHYGTASKREHMTTYYLEKIWNITPEELQNRLHAFYRSDHHKNALPVAGAIEAITTLSKDHSIYIITASPEDVNIQIETWIGKHFTNRFDGIHYVRKTSFDKNIRKKREVCEELNIEVYIDDAIHNAEDVASLGIPVLLLDAPWNQGDVALPIRRIYSWSEIIELLSK